MKHREMRLGYYAAEEVSGVTVDHKLNKSAMLSYLNRN